jgi:hypothetical protein
LLDACAVVVPGHAHQRLRAAAGDAGQHGGEGLKSHGSVLGVDQQPVVAAVSQLLGDGGAVRIEKQTKLGFAFAQLLLELGSSERFTTHSVSSPDPGQASGQRT